MERRQVDFKMIVSHRKESISVKTFESLSQPGLPRVRLISSDSKTFQAPGLAFSFLSRYCDEEHDLVLAPLHSENLYNILSIIELRNVSVTFEDISEDVIRDAELLGIDKASLESLVAAKTNFKRSECPPLYVGEEKRETEKTNLKKPFITFVPKSEIVEQSDEDTDDDDSEDSDEEGEIKREDRFEDHGEDASVNEDEFFETDSDDDSDMTEHADPVDREKIVDTDNDDEDENFFKTKNEKEHAISFDRDQIVDTDNDEEDENFTKATNEKDQAISVDGAKLEETDNHNEDESVFEGCDETEHTIPVDGNTDKKVVKMKASKPRGRPKKTNGAEVCQYCGKVFPPGKDKMRRNHLFRHRIQLFKCDCDVKLGSYNDKERHVKMVHWGQLPCPRCKLTLKSDQSLQYHLLTVHGKSLACTICDYITHKVVHLKKHMQTRHVPKVLKPAAETAAEISCLPCGKVFSSAFNKSQHVRKVHNPQFCSLCDRTFKNLKRHTENVHVDDSKKRFLCTDCGKGFLDRSNLSSHQMNVHIKSRPYKCRYPDCNKKCTKCMKECTKDCTRKELGYNDTANRNAHEKRVHGGLFSRRQDGDTA